MATILVVDDDPLMLKVCSKILLVGHHEVLQARDGHEALQVLQNRTVDVALLDVVMPGMNGIVLAGHIQERNPETEIVLMSGCRPDELAKITSRENPYRVVWKPFTTESLLKMIEMSRFIRGCDRRDFGILRRLRELKIAHVRAPTPTPPRRRRAVNPADRAEASSGRLDSGCGGLTAAGTGDRSDRLWRCSRGLGRRGSAGAGAWCGACRPSRGGEAWPSSPSWWKSGRERSRPRQAHPAQRAAFRQCPPGENPPSLRGNEFCVMRRPPGGAVVGFRRS